MFNIVLYEPEIPSNTGNLIRLCANTGSKLHLVEPLGFSLENRKLRRAGLDYRDLTSVQVHDSFASCRKSIKGDGQLVTFSTHHSRVFSEFQYKPTDILLFGSETKRASARFIRGRRRHSSAYNTYAVGKSQPQSIERRLHCGV